MIPAIDLLEGLAVFLEGGKRDTAQVVSDDPVTLAREWQRRGAKRLHVVDLDAAMGSGDNRDLVRDILRAVAIPVQVGGGLRDEASVRQILAAGAAKAIVGTRAVLDPGWLRSVAVRFPSRVILAVDREARGVLVEGWRRAAARNPAVLLQTANGLPLDGVLFTNVAVEGRMRGLGTVRDPLVDRCRRTKIAAGGATTVEDLRRLKEVGFDHVVVGRALHAGLLDLAEAAEVMP